MSLLTFKGINMIFHAKTKEFLHDFNSLQKTYLPGTYTEVEERLQKSYPQRVFRLAVSHT